MTNRIAYPVPIWSNQKSGGNGVLRSLSLHLFKNDLGDNNRKLFLSHFLD